MPNTPPPNFRSNKSLDASVKDGMASAVRLGAGETYLSAFGIFLNATPKELGLLTSLAPFLGALCQALGVWLTEHFTSRRTIIVRNVVLEALIWIPMASIPFVFGQTSGGVTFLIFLTVLYYSFSGLATPAWNSLIGDLVTPESRGRFFGYRNKYVGICTFISVLTAGFLLQAAKSYEMTGAGFAAIFIVACIARLIAAWYLSRHEDVAYKFGKEHYFSFLTFLLRSPKSNYARFVFFIAAINFSAMIAGPFFSVHMLRELKLSYTEFTIVTAALMISQFLTMQHWGRLTDRFGTKKILNVTGIGVAFSPLFWLFVFKPWQLIFVQIYSGFVWAGFNLAASNFMFDAVSPPKRARCAAYQAIINTACVFVASNLGAFLVTDIPFMTTFGNYLSGGISPYLSIFLLSGLLRLGAVTIFLTKFKEVREVFPIKHRDLVFQIVQLRPIAGATFGLITGKRKEKPPQAEASGSRKS